MTILYVYAHPNRDSLNFQIKQHGCEWITNAGHELIISDLYADQFNAIANFNDFELPDNELNPQYFTSQKIAFTHHALTKDIQVEIEKIKLADHIIFQFPLWWFSVPAILKGWFDRVFVKGFAYDAGKILTDGLLKGKTTSLVVTTQSGEAAYQTIGLQGATIDQFLHPIQHTLRFVGMTTLEPFVEYEVFNVDGDRMAQIIKRYTDYLKDTITTKNART